MIIRCHSIKLIDNKWIIFVGGYKNIYVYRSNNYELIQTFENTHDHYSSGFVEINNTLLYSFSNDNIVKIRKLFFFQSNLFYYFKLIFNNIW